VSSSRLFTMNSKTAWPPRIPETWPRSRMATFLKHVSSSGFYTPERSHRIKVGVNPRVKAPMPSVRHTVCTQCSADLYFCPEAGLNPSVCIRDFIISIGYITAHN
jgi:Pyruvate/2-oxoacid:ferredoxin oxidoreductase delta subunit